MAAVAPSPATAKPAQAPAPAPAPAPQQKTLPKLFDGPIKEKLLTKPDGTKVKLCFKPLKKPDGTIIELPVKPVKQPDGKFKFELLPPKPKAPPGITKPAAVPATTASKPQATTPAARPASVSTAIAPNPQGGPTANKATAPTPAASKQAVPQTVSKPATAPAAAAARASTASSTPRSVPPLAKPVATPSECVATQAKTATTVAPGPTGTRDGADLFGPAPGHGAPAVAAGAPQRGSVDRWASNIEGGIKIFESLSGAFEEANGKKAPAAAPKGAVKTASKPAAAPARGPGVVQGQAPSGTARGFDNVYEQDSTYVQAPSTVTYESDMIFAQTAPGQTSIVNREIDVSGKPANYTVINETSLYEITEPTEVDSYQLQEPDLNELVDVTEGHTDEYDYTFDDADYALAVEGAEDWQDGELDIQYATTIAEDGDLIQTVTTMQIDDDTNAQTDDDYAAYEAYTAVGEGLEDYDQEGVEGNLEGYEGYEGREENGGDEEDHQFHGHDSNEHDGSHDGQQVYEYNEYDVEESGIGGDEEVDDDNEHDDGNESNDGERSSDDDD